MHYPVILFSGDFFPNFEIDHGQKVPSERIFTGFQDLLSGSVIHVSNLESPITNCKTPIHKTGPAIKSSPEQIKLLKWARVDIACLANNHIRDYGDPGIFDTLETCARNGIRTVGAGRTLSEAERTLYITLENKKIAFINCCESEFSIAGSDYAGANPADPVKIFNQIRAARQNADLVIVIFHGGHELLEIPNPYIKRFFHFCADSGAAAVIGHHTHVIGGYEIYHEVPLVYSLGNFFFEDKNVTDPDWYTGLIARLAVKENNRVELALHSVLYDLTILEMRVLEENEAEKVNHRIQKISAIISDDDLLQKSWENFADLRIQSVVKYIAGFSKFKKLLIKAGVPFEKLVKKKRLMLFLNYTRCESHRELTIYALKKLIEQSTGSGKEKVIGS